MSRRTAISLVLLLLVAGLSAIFALINGNGDREPIRASISVAEALRSDTTGFARANRPGRISFPDDHGPHPEFKTEWWYYTGNLDCADTGSPIGFQFTVFRNALVPEPAVGTDWRTNQLYSAHMAVSDGRTGVFLFADKTSRGAAGLAGATASPFRAWVQDWEVRQVGETAMHSSLRATATDFSLDLTLQPERPPIFHGENGLSPKSDDPDNASYYYSFTRLRSTGTVAVRGRACEVEGLTWMDHEWSTSALGPTQVGWDWFALRLSNGWDLMYFQVREQNPEVKRPFVEGTLVEDSADPIRLDRTDITLEVTDRWKSDASGGEYPAGWTLEIPDRQVRLDIQPIIDDQELRLAVQYWEGAVSIVGVAAGSPVTGEGYVELTGYADEAFGELSGNPEGD
ncbi:MAG: carotenoid 1,2-hydratase [Rhodothermia bacterium]|nr:carotenoid 1,2-hydratase [Rhodothermia bacterium]